jgi:hypothetical protein
MHGVLGELGVPVYDAHRGCGFLELIRITMFESDG